MKTRTLISLCCVTACCTLDARAQSLEWKQQLGTTSDDVSNGVAADGMGGIYISGRTFGTLDGLNAGASDAFLSKYDSSGNILWTRQLGSAGLDESAGVSVDGLGNVYISGMTEGTLDGLNVGGADAFLSKYDSSGNIQWTRQLGTSDFDFSLDVSADGLGGVFLSGFSQGDLGGTNAGGFDAFLSKYDSSGNVQWTQQLGTSGADSANGVAADGLGNVYISGETQGVLGDASAGGFDAFLSKYDSSGNVQWTRQLGTSGTDSARSVTADGLGNIYLSGTTGGDLAGVNAGLSDAFLSKYDDDGTPLWTQQFGTSGLDEGWGVTTDELGDVYISGNTNGALGGVGFDVFLSRFNSSGELQWTQQFGTSSADKNAYVSADGLGALYVSGRTEGSLGGPNAGGYDAFLAKVSTAVPEPGTATLLLLAAFLQLMARTNRHRRTTIGGQLVVALAALLICVAPAMAKKPDNPDGGGGGGPAYDIFPFSPFGLTSTSASISDVNPLGTAIVGSGLLPSGELRAVHFDVSSRVYTTLAEGIHVKAINNNNQMVGQDNGLGLFLDGPAGTSITLSPLGGDTVSLALSVNDGGIITGLSRATEGVSGVSVIWRVTRDENDEIVVDGPLALPMPGMGTLEPTAHQITELTDGSAMAVGDVAGEASVWTIEVDAQGKLLPPALPQGLGTLNLYDPSDSTGRAINNNGDVVGYSDQQPFIVPAGEPMEQLPLTRKALYGNAQDINDAGAVVGQIITMAKGFNCGGRFCYDAAMWTDGEPTYLDSLIDRHSDWERLSIAYDISDTGVIAGFGQFGSDVQSFIMVPNITSAMSATAAVPEPSGIFLAVIGLFGAVVRARRTRRGPS